MPPPYILSPHTDSLLQRFCETKSGAAGSA